MERINGQLPGIKTLAMKVLLWIACAKRQLTTSELQHALAIKPEKSNFDYGDLPHIGDIISICAGLVAVDEESGITRLVHYTTQEYLKRTREQWFQDAHSVITTACVTYLSFTTFETEVCKTVAEVWERLRSNPFYDYAANNWGHHAREDATSSEVIIKFLKSKAKVEASSQALAARRERWSFGLLNRPVHPSGTTGLHLAGFFGLSEAVDTLLGLGYSPDLKDNILSRTSLWYAAWNGHGAVVQLLVAAGADVNAASTGQTALQAAAEEGHLEVIEKLLAAGADINAATNYGLTALLAAVVNGHLEVIEKLLAAGADVNAAALGDYGPTALQVAVEEGDPEVVEKLLVAGADVNAADNYGLTALLVAVMNGHLEVIEKLLVAGADVNTVATDYRPTALQVAAMNGHLEVIEKLLAAGADVNAAAVGDDGRTALQAAAEEDHPEVVEKLLEHIDDKFLTDDVLLGLIDAIEYPKGLALFEVLMARALDRETWKMIKDPYHRAVRAGSSNVVDALKKRGVDPTGLDEDNWSCVDYATKLDRLELLDSLREQFEQHAKADHARLEHAFPTALQWSTVKQSPLVTSCSTSSHQECTGIHQIKVHKKAQYLEQICIRSKRCAPPLSASSKYFYFEVTVLKDSNSRLLGLGFCGEDIGRDQMPGWFDGSWAYHGDDGKLFIGQGRGEALTPDFGASGKFGAGDVVGTCLNLETGEGFCILNGKGLNMGYASERMKLKFKAVKTYPCVGFDTTEDGVGLQFMVNLGASSNHPFMYTGPFY